MSIPKRAAGLAAAVVSLAMFGLVALGCSDDEDDPLSTEEFCQQLEADRDIIELFGQLETSELEAKRQSLDELALEAPPEIQDEFAVLVDYIDAAVDTLSTVPSGDVDGAEEALRPLQEQAAEATEAGHVVEPWVGENCGFEMRTGSSLPPPTTAPPTTAAPPTTEG